MDRLLSIHHERLALWGALSQSSALLIGILLASAVGGLFGLAVSWGYVSFFGAGLVVLAAAQYLGGFGPAGEPVSPGRLFLRLALSSALLVAAGTTLGAPLPPAGTLAALQAIALAFAMAAVPMLLGGMPLGMHPPASSLAAPPVLRRRVLLVGGRETAGQEALPPEDLEPHAIVCGRVAVDLPPEGPDGVGFAALAEPADRILRAARRARVSMVVLEAEPWPPSVGQLALLLGYGGLDVGTREALLQQQRGVVELPTRRAAETFVQAHFHGLRRHTLLAKRGLDILLSASALLLFAPLLLAVAVAVRLDSPGPVLYRQVRVGRNERPFEILKFRSMRADAEGDGTARWASRDDDRITRIGHLIRKTRLDELPQLVNVLRGDMSLVGPRPERPEFVVQLRRLIPAYELRHLVRPGLTGWAQINYPYSASIEETRHKLGFDLYYVRDCGILLDLLILMRTLRVVVRREGV